RVVVQLLLVVWLVVVYVDGRAPSGVDPLSLHDALPISRWSPGAHPRCCRGPCGGRGAYDRGRGRADVGAAAGGGAGRGPAHSGRSEEHTSELQSRFDLVCRLLLEKKKEVLAAGRGGPEL